MYYVQCTHVHCTCIMYMYTICRITWSLNWRIFSSYTLNRSSGLSPSILESSGRSITSLELGGVGIPNVAARSLWRRGNIEEISELFRFSISRNWTWVFNHFLNTEACIFGFRNVQYLKYFGSDNSEDFVNKADSLFLTGRGTRRD